MSCILHTIGARVTFPADIEWLHESASTRGMVESGETAIIKSIDRQNHKLTVEIESKGLQLTVDASIFYNTPQKLDSKIRRKLLCRETKAGLQDEEKKKRIIIPLKKWTGG